MARVVCDPVTRIEGHLGVNIEHDGSNVTDANVYSTMYRGFENIVKGRDPRDAIQITQRICGVCPVPHGLVSTFSCENAMGWVHPSPGPNDGYSSHPTTGARLVRNLILGAEFLMSHITHFYLLSALDLVQGPNMAPWTPYWSNANLYDELLRNGGTYGSLSWTGGAPNNIYTAVITDYVLAVRTRIKALNLGGIFAGRLPIQSSWVAGGVTANPTSAQVTQAQSLLAEVKSFIENNYIPMTEIVSVLYGIADNSQNTWATALTSDPVLATVPGGGYKGARSVPLFNDGANLGAGCKNFLSMGVFDGSNDGTNSTRLLKRGCYNNASNTGPGTAEDFDPNKILEYVNNSRYTDTVEARCPKDGVTNPNPSAATTNGYPSWHKAPRYINATDTGQTEAVKEVGALARMWVNGNYQGGQSKDFHNHAFSDPSTVAKAWGYLASDDSGMTAGKPLPALKKLLTDSFSVQYKCGISVLDRHRARALEALKIADEMQTWLTQLSNLVNASGWKKTDTTNYSDFGYNPNAKPLPTAETYGCGCNEAPRGSVFHWQKIKNKTIQNYQVVAPTTWNGSPKDGKNRKGPIEQALIGAPVVVASNIPVSALVVIHSFDPCIACSVHIVEPKDKKKVSTFIMSERRCNR